VLERKSKKENILIEKIIFERKEIREYTSWSFVQIYRNHTGDLVCIDVSE